MRQYLKGWVQYLTASSNSIWKLFFENCLWNSCLCRFLFIEPSAKIHNNKNEPIHQFSSQFQSNKMFKSNCLSLPLPFTIQNPAQFQFNLFVHMPFLSKSFPGQILSNSFLFIFLSRSSISIFQGDWKSFQPNFFPVQFLVPSSFQFQWNDPIESNDAILQLNQCNSEEV